MEYQSESSAPTGLRMDEISNEAYLVTQIADRNGTSVEPWLTCISAFDAQCPDFVGQWLVQLYKRMIIAIQLNNNKTDLEPLGVVCGGIDNRWCDWFNAVFFMNSNTHGNTKHNCKYVDKLERNLKIAFNDSSTVTTTDVMWELCNWRNTELEKAADQGGTLPLILRTALWPEITPQVVFNLHRAVMDENTVEDDKFSNYITTSTSQLWMDADSDTELEARVSPEDSHPLTSGDPIEDEEMLARAGLSPNAEERLAFTNQLCDNA